MPRKDPQKAREYKREYNKTHKAQRKKYNDTHKTEIKAYGHQYRAIKFSTLHGALNELYKHAKNGSKRRKLVFDIDFSDILNLWHIQNGICPISRLKMDLTADAENWTKPSLDRIDPNVGYVISNIRLVCKWVNLAKWDRTDIQFESWCCIIARKLGYRKP